MKKQHFLWLVGIYLILTQFPITAFAQSGYPIEGVGINVDTPRATLHVGGTARIDSVPLLTALPALLSHTPNHLRLLIVDSTHIVHSLRLDSFLQAMSSVILPHVSPSIDSFPEIIITDNILYGGSYSFTFYNKNPEKNILVYNTNIICFYNKTYGIQRVNLDSIWGMPGYGINLYGTCIIDSFAYFCSRYTDTTKIFRIPLHSFKNNSAQRVAITGKMLGIQVPTVMTANGKNGNYFYFTESGGYTGFSNQIAKYELVGNVLVYRNNITISSLTGSLSSYFVRDNGTIMIYENTTAISKIFDQGGNLLRVIKNYNPYHVYKWKDYIYTQGFTGANGLLRRTMVYD
jgi:hypothetical protein